MSTDDYDRFADVQEDVHGIFGADQPGMEPGLKKHESVLAKPTREGVVLELSCQGCGKPTKMTIEWPEVVALKYGVNPVIAFRAHPGVVKFPTRWEFLPHEHSWRPEMKCRHCQFWIPLRISPDEPERFLKVGRRNGLIHPAGEKQVSQVAAAAAAQGQAVRR